MPESQEIQSRQCSDGYIELDPLQAEIAGAAKHRASTPGLSILGLFKTNDNKISVVQAAYHIFSACEHGEVYKITQIQACRTVNAKLRNRAAVSNRRSCVGQMACNHSRLDDLLQKICITVASVVWCG